MSKRFAGTHAHKVEERGRVSLPASFRKVLAALGTNDLFIIPQMKRGDAHIGMSGEAYDAFCARVEAELTTQEDRDAFTEFVEGRAVPLEADEVGRIVLGAALRESLGIKKELVFVGLGHHFEIRAPDAHTARAAESGERARPLIAGVSMTGLHG